MPSFLPHRINIYQWMKFLTLCPCASEPTILYNQETYLLSTGFCCVCVCLCPSEGGGTIAPDCAPSSIFDTSRVKRNTGRRIHTPRYTLQTTLSSSSYFIRSFFLSLSLSFFGSLPRISFRETSHENTRVFPTKINYLRSTVFFNALLQQSEKTGR